MPDIIMSSKYRKEYWIRQFIQYGGVLAILGLCIKFSIHDGKIDFLNGLFWLACLFFIFMIVYLINFLGDELKSISLTETTIEIKYILTKEHVSILYTDIIKFNSHHITSGSSVGQISDGYSDLVIELKNGESITFDEDQYKNFLELKNCIYRHRLGDA